MLKDKKQVNFEVFVQKIYKKLQIFKSLLIKLANKLLTKLSLSYFYWSLGVIAQEFVEVLPEAVTETGDVELPNGEKIDKFLVVDKVSLITPHNLNK